MHCKEGIRVFKDFELARRDNVKEKGRLQKEGPKVTTGGFTCNLAYVAAPVPSVYPLILT